MAKNERGTKVSKESNAPAPSPGARPRRSKVRTAILASGQALFSKYGIDAITVDDIVQAADVAKGSFYNHFSTKAELAHELSTIAREDVEHKISQASANVVDPALRVARAIATYAQLAVEDPERALFIARLLAQQVSPTSRGRGGVRKDICGGLESGRFAIDTIEASVMLQSGIVQMLIRYIVIDSGKEDARSMTEQMILLGLRGLGLTTEDAMAIAVASVEDVMV